MNRIICAQSYHIISVPCARQCQLINWLNHNHSGGKKKKEKVSGFFYAHLFVFQLISCWIGGGGGDGTCTSGTFSYWFWIFIRPRWPRAHIDRTNWVSCWFHVKRMFNCEQIRGRKWWWCWWSEKLARWKLFRYENMALELCVRVDRMSSHYGQKVNSVDFPRFIIELQRLAVPIHLAMVTLATLSKRLCLWKSRTTIAVEVNWQQETPHRFKNKS